MRYRGQERMIDVPLNSEVMEQLALEAQLRGMTIWRTRHRSHSGGAEERPLLNGIEKMSQKIVRMPSSLLRHCYELCEYGRGTETRYVFRPKQTRPPCFIP